MQSRKSENLGSHERRRYGSAGTRLQLGLGEEPGTKTQKKQSNNRVKFSDRDASCDDENSSESRDRSRDRKATYEYIGRYDMRNSSTKLVLMNNRYPKKRSVRMRKDVDSEEKPRPSSVDPARHERKEPPETILARHVRCQSAREPRFRCHANQQFQFQDRPKTAHIGPYLYEGVSAVNPYRHRRCRPVSAPATPVSAIPGTARSDASHTSSLLPVSERPLHLSPYAAESSGRNTARSSQSPRP